jgi:hypothetical protein
MRITAGDLRDVVSQLPPDMQAIFLPEPAHVP